MPATGISLLESIASFILVSFWRCVKISGRRQDGAPLISNGAPVSETPDGEELLGDSGEPGCIAKVKDWGGWTNTFQEGVLFCGCHKSGSVVLLTLISKPYRYYNLCIGV